MSNMGAHGGISEEVSPNAIAVVGMGCKFPGAESVDEYWRMLDAGQSKLSEPPKGRFPTHEHQRTTDKTVYYGNYLDDISTFDNKFFKKSGREAASMDPQQRLLLEVSYQALESSGFFGPREPDLDVGCFIGVCASDYNDNVASHPSNAFSALGTLRAFVPGRVSHFFGLSGPSIALDTACSSSAVAIDAACKAILHGDCKSAIAGGVSVFTSPFFYQNLAAASFLSPTGASKSFDANADGYCRGEGVGLVVLKRLSDAVADGDNILGTILATAVRQSSNKVPITVPYVQSQTKLYRSLLSTAGIAAEDVTYVEAHGTGTPVGDPLEFGAIKEVFGVESREDPLYFASVKGNIGHTEGASGVAGLIKTLLMMQNRAIPRQANYKAPHQKISLVPGQISIPTTTVPWTARSLVACVNNYGAAGSIAAMVVKQAPPSLKRVAAQQNSDPVKYPILVTANSAKSLSENCAKLRDFVARRSQDLNPGNRFLANLAYTLIDRQNRSLPHVFATTVSSLPDLEAQLRLLQTNPDSSLSTSSAAPKPVVLIFGGQTSRSVGLNRQVYESSALLRKYLDECNEIVKGFGHKGIYPGIFNTEPTDDVVLLQTMQFALHYACAQSWIACGLKVDCIMGHSFGQLVAMTVAGALSLEDGLRLVYGRAVLMRDRWSSEKGSMIALEADRATTMDLITKARQSSGSSIGPEVACFNGPSSHVVVGSSAEIAFVRDDVARRYPGTKAKVLNVTHGFHSRFSESIVPELRKLAEGLNFRQPSIYLETCSESATWSAVTAGLTADHTRTPVYFEDAVKRVEARLGSCTWLEAGSNSSVTGMARRALGTQNGPANSHHFVPINLSRSDAVGTMAETTIDLCKHGHHVQFWPFHYSQSQEYQALNLPPYQFEKNQHWVDFDLQAGGMPSSNAVKLSAPRETAVEPEPVPTLLTFSGFRDTGRDTIAGAKEAVFTIDPRSEEWKVLVSGHSVLHESLCPAPLYIELVLRAAKQIGEMLDLSCLPFSRVENLEMPSPLGMSPDKIVQLVLSPTDEKGLKYNFSFFAHNRGLDPQSAVAVNQPSSSHAVGTCEIMLSHDTSVISEMERTKKLLQHMQPSTSQNLDHKFAEVASQAGGEAVQGSLVYKVFSRVVQYHDFYHGVRRLASNEAGTVMAEVHLPEPQPDCTKDLLSTPVGIDNFFQVPGLFANCLAPCPPEEVFVSTHVERIQLSPNFGKQQASKQSPGWDVFALSTALGDKESSNDIFVTDKGTGELVFVAFGAKFSRVRTASLAKILSRANPSNKTDTVSSRSAANEKLSSGFPTSRPQVAVPSRPEKPPAAQQVKIQAAPTVYPAPEFLSPQHATQHAPQQKPKTEIRKASARNELREMLSKMTDVPQDQFQGNVTLDELGIDSLMATEIVTEVQENFHITIPQDSLQDLQTFESLCNFIDSHASGQTTESRPPVPPSLAEETPSVNEVPLMSVQSSKQNAQGHREEQPAAIAENTKNSAREQRDHSELISKLATLLGSHLECPASDFSRSTGLVDRGLDSLLSMELVSDMEEMFEVSIDATLLTMESNFGDLADILINAVDGGEQAADSSSMTSSPSQSSGCTTPGTTPAITPGIHLDKSEFIHIPSPNSRSASNAVLANAPRAFEDIKGDFDKWAAEYGFTDFYTVVAPKQAHLVLAYVVEAFSELGADLHSLKPGDKIPQVTLAPKHERMRAVFHEILRKGRIADYNGSEYVRSDAAIDKTPSSALFANIVTEFPQHAKEHMLLNICGAEMSKLITGKMDPLAVLFGNKANRTILEDVYTSAPMFIINSRLLTAFFEKALSESTLGPDGKFHICELGAGTGATTRWVVERLVERGVPIEYTFTDISSALVSGSKRKFSQYDCMKFGTIDIEKEPQAQYLGKFDIVLATNCIHATTNLHNSLGNINKLLKPHGIVSLVELTTRNYWLDMVFGLLDGWWLYSDERPYVLATPEFWEKTMHATGFQHVAWTGGHKQESEVCRVITGFKQAVDDPSLYRSVPQGTAGGVETVVFAHTDKKLPLRADVHYPSPSQASAHKTWIPGLVIHGGGHVMLSRQDVRPRQIQLLLDHGVLPVSVDYRLCPETTILEGPLVDVNKAYDWMRNKLSSLRLTKTSINHQLDASRAVVVGWSTGGTLAMSLAWTSIPHGLAPPDAILAFYCPTDYEDEFWTKTNVPEHSESFANESYNIIDGVHPAPITAYNVPSKTMAAAGWIAPKDPRSRVVLHMNWHGQTLPVLFRGLPSSSAVSAEQAGQYNFLEQPPKEDIVRASPLAQVARGNYKSPTHIIFGTKDDLIPWGQAQRTVDAMRGAGVEAGLTLAPGQPHLFDMYRDPDGSRWGYVMEGYDFLFRKIGRRA